MLITTRKKRLLKLCEDWEREAKIRLIAEEKEKTEFGKRFLTNGAFIYFNVSRELRAAIQPKIPFIFRFKKFTKCFKRANL